MKDLNEKMEIAKKEFVQSKIKLYKQNPITIGKIKIRNFPSLISILKKDFKLYQFRNKYNEHLKFRLMMQLLIENRDKTNKTLADIYTLMLNMD